jgi:hypothetical protein
VLNIEKKKRSFFGNLERYLDKELLGKEDPMQIEAKEKQKEYDL